MREPKIGDVVTIHKWSYAKIRFPQKGIIKEIRDFNQPNERYQLEIEEDHNGGKNQTWCFDRSDFTIDEEESVLIDREGRPLKKFEVGKWYTNPMYDYVSPTGKFRALYFRVQSVILHKNSYPRGSYFNEFVFDAVASANWEKFDDVRLTQSNCNFDQQMQLVENPYDADIHQAVKQIIERQHPNQTPFRIGDRVEAIRGGANVCRELKHDRTSEKGETGVITNIYREDVEIKLDKDGQYSTRLYSNLKILESAPKVEPVQTESQFYDGPCLVGRYVQAKKDTCYGVKAGEYLLIESEDPDHWFIEKYLSCTKRIKEHGYLTNVFDLMLEGFVPPSTKTNMEDIQRQCKEKFPIGSKVKNTHGFEHVIENDNTVYEIVGNQIYSSSGRGLLYNNGKWAELIELPKAIKASSPSKVYDPLPVPKDKSNIVYWEVVKDIPENSILNSSGKPFTHPFIPRGTITWTDRSYEKHSMIHIENNIWRTNFPKELFRMIGTSQDITTEPLVNPRVVILSTSDTVVVHQADIKPPIKENPSPIRTINTIQTKLKNKNKKVRL